MRSIFHHFKKGLSVIKNCLRPSGAPSNQDCYLLHYCYYTNSFIGIFTFLSLNNYGFSNLLLLFVQIKYLIVCAIHLDNNLITNITLLIFYYITPWFKMILSHKNLKCFTRKLLYERSSAVTPLPSIYLRLQNQGSNKQIKQKMLDNP